MIAFLEAHRAGLYVRKQWLPNIVAGVIVGVVALPLAMAFAIASGARPEQGLYTAIVAGLLVSMLGGSRLQIAGPTGAFIAILSGITAKYGIAGLQLATMMAGVMLLLMGLARMGNVIKFIPSPVIAGFTAGIGVIIFVGQWHDFFGLPSVTGEHFHQKLWHLILVLPQLHFATVALALLALLLIIFTPRIALLKRVPGPLVAMLVCTSLQAFFQLEGVATIGSAFGEIPRGLPAFALPSFTLAQIIALIGPAFTIALLGSIESLLSAVVADGMAGTKHDSNQELIGQGCANIVAPLFGGFAATGAIARTATNVRNGATSPLAGIVHALSLAAVLIFLAPLASHVPLAALAAILFVVAWNISEVKHVVKTLGTAPLSDRVILIITLLLTVFVDLVVAVNVGVILAVLQFMRRMADVVETQEADPELIKSDLAVLGITALPADTLIYEISGPLFFGAVENFKRVLLQTHAEPKNLILRMRSVPFIDLTGIQSLESVIGDLQQRGVKVHLCETNARLAEKLRRSGVLALLQDQDCTQSLVSTLGGKLHRAEVATS